MRRLLRWGTSTDCKVKNFAVCPREGEPPNVFLARFVRGGKVGLKWLAPIVVFDREGNYTVTVKKLYGESFGD